MKLLLVSPCQYEHRRLSFSLRIPQISLNIIAALTPSYYEIKIVEEELEEERVFPLRHYVVQVVHLPLGIDQRTERRKIVVDFIRDRLEHSMEIVQVMFYFVKVLAEKVHQVDYGIVISSFDN